MMHGGSRPGAGARSTWRTPGPTCTIRVPAALALQVLDLARELDAGGPVLYDHDSNAAAVAAAVAVLQAELTRQATHRGGPRRAPTREALSALEHFQARKGPPAPGLETDT